MKGSTAVGGFYEFTAMGMAALLVVQYVLMVCCCLMGCCFACKKKD